MHFHIDPNSKRPIIRQVIEQLQWQIVSGRVRPGDRLPSIRELAKQLKVNPTTVTRIYSELAAVRSVQHAEVQAMTSQPEARDL
ncbi:MAG: GntR family transcriptional regulator [Fuerstia sp.]|nr:GntR family transcriptional regulator [Fuerstiella sp.]